MGISDVLWYSTKVSVLKRKLGFQGPSDRAPIKHPCEIRKSFQYKLAASTPSSRKASRGFLKDCLSTIYTEYRRNMLKRPTSILHRKLIFMRQFRQGWVLFRTNAQRKAGFWIPGDPRGGSTYLMYNEGACRLHQDVGTK